MISSDDIGERGQWLFALLITELCGRDTPSFRPRFLGEKFPTFDCIVELADHPAYYFFVQVKATSQGYTRDPIRLKIQVSQEDVDRMVACPAPTYVVGVDATTKGLGFLLSVNEPRPQVAGLTREFRIECATLKGLYDEVYTYWSARDMTLPGSRFRE
jgi:hypothetical protein